jgi:hypothetical protein
VSAPLLFTTERKQLFLEKLEETCSVKQAAEAVGVNRRTAHHHKKQDLEFSREWDAAIERALDELLGEAHKRATLEKSDRLLEVLLKFRYGDRMADRLSVKVEASTGLSQDVLLLMTPEDRLALLDLLGKYLDAEQRLDEPMHLEHKPQLLLLEHDELMGENL